MAGAKFKKDIVYLHMFPRRYTKGVVNLSPFAIKVETWLRLKKVPYEVVETTKFSKKTRQIPYIIYKGEEYPDSSLIIEFLCKEFNIDPGDGLSEEQQAVTRAFSRMVDDCLSLTYFLYRYYYHRDEFSKYFKLDYWPNFLSSFVRSMMGRGVKKRADTQGVGRKGESDIMELGCKDVRAISKYLGDKQFFMGDNMTTIDCAIFGHFSQIAYVNIGYPHKKLFETECKNIMPYLNRIKDTLWTDWSELCDFEGEFPPETWF